MRVHIFNSQSSFRAVLYNISKVSNDRAELMCAKNFHAIGLFKNIKPQDYIDYLLCQSAASRISKPQFHVVIDSRSQQKSKWELTQIAQEWLQKMGYGLQPYLIFFHKDTSINHIHIVSTRVNRDGKVINDAFEGLNALDQLNIVLGIDSKKQAQQNLRHALNYKFSSRMEFVMLLYAMQYICKLKNNNLLLIRHGRVQATLPLESLYSRISHVELLPQRLQELQDIFFKSIKHHQASIRKTNYFKYLNFSSYPVKCTSDLITHLHKQYGLQLVFHSRNRILPTDYCIIDHINKTILDGKYIMPIAEFIRPVSNNNTDLNVEKKEELTQKIELNATEAESIGALLISNFNMEIADDMDDQAVFGRKNREKKKFKQ